MLSNSETISGRNFTAIPFLWLTVSFIAGILAANFLGFPKEAFLGGSFITCLFIIIFRKKSYAVIFIALAFAMLGGFCLETEKSSISPNRLRVLFDSEQLKSGEPFGLTGISHGKPEVAVGGFFLIVKTETLTSKGIERSASGKVRLFVPIQNEQNEKDAAELQIGFGSRLRIASELNRGERFQNPGGISYKEILDSQGIDATGIVKSPLLIENLGETNELAIFNPIYETRQNLIIEFKERFSVSTAGVLIASLLGNKYHLDKATATSFREGGTFHMLVISGLQITFIGGIVILILRQFTRNRLWQFLLSSFFLWAYTLAVGAEAPVTRAAIMFSVLHFGYAVFRRANPVNMLAISALILLVWRPSDIFNQSFQLTFICVLAIVGMSLPLLEKIREIGEWSPGVGNVVPPIAPKWIKTLAECLYWSEKNWRRQQIRTVWKCGLFKTPFAEKLERWRIQAVLRLLFEALLVSIIVQLWLIPLAATYFHRISFASLFLNIFTGVLIAIESLSAILGILFAQFSEIFAAPFIWFAEIFNSLILNTTQLFVEQNWSSIRIPHYSGEAKVIYLLYFIPVIVLTTSLHLWKPNALRSTRVGLNSLTKSAAGSFLLLLGIIIFNPFSAPPPNGRLQIDFLDVGQGDSAFVTLPTGETILVDGGGRPNFNKLYVEREGEEPELFEPDTQSIGETVVSNFLWERGYDRVDYLIPSHADADHIQGLGDIAQNFDIKAAILARKPIDDADFAEFSQTLERKKIPSVIVQRGDVLEFGGVKIEVLFPFSDENPNAKWDNNHGIVLRIIYGETKFLLTADIEKEAEKELLQMPELLQANVVKVAHHGSKSSSIQPFVDATAAKLAIISVGKQSQFGHPHKEVVERWEKSGAKILKTGERGTITLISDGKIISVETYVK